MIITLLVCWYLFLLGGFAYSTYVAFGKSLWSYNSAKPWIKYAVIFLVVGIITLCAVSYFK